MQGGPFDDLVVNLSKKPLHIRTSGGMSRICSGTGDDIYSVVMHVHSRQDVLIWEKAGENILHIRLKNGSFLNDAKIGRYEHRPGYVIHVEPDNQIAFIFLDYREEIEENVYNVPGNTVQIIMEETTGKRIVFEKVRNSPNAFPVENSVGSYYDKFAHCKGDPEVATLVQEILPPYGETLPEEMCHPRPDQRSD